jgi:hypothetical protein
MDVDFNRIAKYLAMAFLTGLFAGASVGLVAGDYASLLCGK